MNWRLIALFVTVVLVIAWRADLPPEGPIPTTPTTTQQTGE
jgi:hypothetical protein